MMLDDGQRILQIESVLCIKRKKKSIDMRGQFLVSFVRTGSVQKKSTDKIFINNFK